MVINLDIGAIQHKLQMATNRLESVCVSGYSNISSLTAAMQCLLAARSDLAEALKSHNEQITDSNKSAEEE